MRSFFFVPLTLLLTAGCASTPDQAKTQSVRVPLPADEQTTSMTLIHLPEELRVVQKRYSVTVPKGWSFRADENQKDAALPADVPAAKITSAAMIPFGSNLTLSPETDVQNAELFINIRDVDPTEYTMEQLHDEYEKRPGHSNLRLERIGDHTWLRFDVAPPRKGKKMKPMAPTLMARVRVGQRNFRVLGQAPMERMGELVDAMENFISSVEFPQTP